MTIIELNYWVAIGSILMQLGALALLVLAFIRVPLLEPLKEFISKHALLFGFLLSLIALVMSLVYSEYYGVVPCGLCWFSRILLYPQVILFGIALLKRDYRIADYSIGLSIAGAAVSLYHHYLQMAGTHGLPCPAAGAVDCGKRFIFEFGYVTFPMIGLSVFLILIMLMVYARRRASA